MLKKNLAWFLGKYFFYFGQKTLFRSCEKFKNIILFTNYVKFNPETFYYYIFCLNIFLQILSLKFDLIWFLY
jgi:hypothetical protein